MIVSSGATEVSREIKFLGPATRACASEAPCVTEIAAPLHVAPLLAEARKNSSVTGANRQAEIGRPLSTSAAETVQSGKSARKARVPSIGSTIQTKPALGAQGP